MSIDETVGIVSCFTVVGLIGARAMYVLGCENFLFMPMSDICDLQSGGLSVLGSLIIVPIALFAWTFFKGRSLLPVLNIACFCAPILDVFGRLGCFFGGCCYGIVSYWFPVVYLDPLAGAPIRIPLFPVQLFTSALFLLVFGVFWWMRLYIDTDKPLQGFFIAAYFSCAAFIRFSVDFFRGDRGEAIVTMWPRFITTYQAGCLVIGFCALGMLGFILLRKYKKFGAL